MKLISPATYLSLSAFKAQASGAVATEIAKYSDPQLTDILVRASARVDGIVKTTYLPTEVTENFEGNGTNELSLDARPLIYVKSVQLVMPGFSPFALPLGQLMIDFKRGVIRSWSPMIWQSLGVANVFPKNGLPIIATFAHGFGYPIPPPSFSVSTAQQGTLTPGTPVNLAISTRTYSGESLPSVPQSAMPTSQGGLVAIIAPVPGAFVYRIYASIGPKTTNTIAESAGASTFTPASMAGITSGTKLTLGLGTANAEDVVVDTFTGTTFTTISATLNAHADGESIVASMTLVTESPATNYGGATMNVAIVNLNPPDIGALVPQTVDSSAWPIPNEFLEATRILGQSMIWEDNNQANRGVTSVGSGTKKVGYRSTEGNSGKGIPVPQQVAEDLLSGYVFSGCY